MAAGLRTGTNTAFAQLFTDHVARLRPIIQRQIRRHHMSRFVDWEDVWQDVLLSFTAGATRGDLAFECPAQLLGLLIRMSNHRVADVARHHRREDRAVNHSLHSAAQADFLIDEASQPGHLVDMKDFLAWALLQLPEWAREIASRRALDETWEQVASGEGCSAEALRKRFDRAFVSVRKESRIAQDENEAWKATSNSR